MPGIVSSRGVFDFNDFCSGSRQSVSADGDIEELNCTPDLQVFACSMAV